MFRYMLAAYDTQTGKGTYYYSIDIPDGLSLLAGYNPNAKIIGLNDFAPADRPNPLPVHLSFDGMVGSGFFILAIAALFWLLYFLRKRRIPENRWMLLGILVSGPLSFLSVELGWMVTEEGRQPWVIYGLLRTSQAVTTAPFLNYSFLAFSAIYLVLATTMIVLLLRQGQKPLPKMEWQAVASGDDESEQTTEEQAMKIGV